MKSQISQKIATVLVPTALFLGMVSPAFALDIDPTRVKTTVNTELRVDKKTREEVTKEQEARNRALDTKTKTEIEQKVRDLEVLKARLNGMKNVSAETKASVSATLDTAVLNMNAWRSKAGVEVDSGKLASDAKSIASSIRAFSFVKQQTNILAAADRINKIVDLVSAMNVKLQNRITAAEASGRDISAIVALQTSLTTKLAEAKIQAKLAIDSVTGLTPDNGDQAKLAANQRALKVSRTAIKTAERALHAAQKDVRSIISILQSVHPKSRVETQSSVTTDGASTSVETNTTTEASQ